jgi:hypothetical protein
MAGEREPALEKRTDGRRVQDKEERFVQVAFPVVVWSSLASFGM